MSVTKYVGEEALQELVTKMKAYADATGVPTVTTATNMWELDTGIYNGNINLFYYKQGYDLGGGLLQNQTATVIIDKWTTNNGTTTLYFAVSGGMVYSGSADATWGNIHGLTLNAIVVKTDIIDNLNTERSDLPLSAKMGKTLNTTLSTKQNTLTFDSAPTNSSTNPVTSGGVYTALSGKQDVLTFDTTPTSASTNPVTSGGVYTSVNGLDTRLTTVEGKIPSAATSSNQLADKAFVNSSIATATATFKGSYNLVDTLGLTLTASHSDVATALGTAISGEDNNDYCWVEIPTTQGSNNFSGDGVFTGIIQGYDDAYILTITVSNKALTSISSISKTTGQPAFLYDGMGTLSNWTQSTTGTNPQYTYSTGPGYEPVIIYWLTNGVVTPLWEVKDDGASIGSLRRQIAQIDKYKYNGTSWVYEYTLNNSSFTSDQWAAINSGITSSLVTQIGTNQSNITSLQSSKQDVIDSSHKLSADLISDGTTNKTVTATEKSTWSAKQDAMTAITTAEVDALFS